MKTLNRRKLLTAATATAAATLIPIRTLAAEKLDESDPTAIALGYKEDAEAVDVTKFPKRAGAEGAKQFCSNCALYEDVDGDYGTCSAIPGKLVAGPGWCNVWVLKT